LKTLDAVSSPGKLIVSLLKEILCLFAAFAGFGIVSKALDYLEYAIDVFL
jgi:hypothetical protein